MALWVKDSSAAAREKLSCLAAASKAIIAEVLGILRRMLPGDCCSIYAHFGANKLIAQAGHFIQDGASQRKLANF
jgi:hypothetical protein